ncbi:MAG: hypothetical protein E6H57_04840 [Betaproteobacteria bacterium]|nr:MAG: hypothetical protein E6H57_04840 [Betaproteobacteria bacterium]
MEAKLSPGVGVLILLGVASAFASNHLCARIAFDHGVSVAAAVSVRATFTALLLLAVMRFQHISISIPRALRAKTLLAGLLIASQSYCLYSAVALIGKERPRWRALAPMLLALAGLALALNLRPDHFDADWAAVRAGVGWAFASGVSMTLVYYLNANALKPLDGRLRTFAMTAVTAILVIVAGAATGAHALPRDGAGLAGVMLLAVFYCIAMISLFFVLPRLPSTSTAALNFEPIALLVLGWLILGITVTRLQIVGALLTVSAIAWLGVAKR